MPMNLKGRVFLGASFFWGVIAYVVIYYLNPFIAELAAWTYSNFYIWPALFIFMFMLADVSYNFGTIRRAKKYLRSAKDKKDKLDS
jgi:uncharacterized membrane protein